MGKRYFKAKCQVKDYKHNRARGITSDEYIMSDGRIRGSCYGYIDPMYDEALDVCKACEDYYLNVGEEEWL